MRYLSKVSSTKTSLVVGKLWLFGLFSGDKGDNIDMWMIKITMKTNQIDMNVLLISTSYHNYFMASQFLCCNI